ncbi:MAG: ATP-binding cassette domain-containing protein [Deltaproteobacteria bacterium]|nr:ATP-binding cassette domain-containing protein [Deltaproteobacteria bacterium]
MIEVHQLSKTYRVPLKAPGLAGSLRSLFGREYREVRAVREVSFRVEQGERVGFLGPNGAGKTTTLKMLSGLLHPTAGEVSVLGFTPKERRRDFLRQITLVMGQKQQLLWDLPPRETFELNRAMYDLPRAGYRNTLDELVTMLRIEALLEKPTRNLSLGERMKCELAAALLHRPRVLFLDEPTIGLDVEMQVEVRRFIADINERFGATVLLTSHYMQDIAALTSRLLVIDRGHLRYDGGRDALAQRIAPERRVLVRGENPALLELGFVADHGRMVASVPTDRVNGLIGEVLAALPEAVLGVEEIPLDEVMARYFRSEDEPAS